MTEAEVVELMESATSKQDWRDKCDEVKHRCGGYPSFWYSAIIASGVGDRVCASFGAHFGVRVFPLEFNQ